MDELVSKADELPVEAASELSVRLGQPWVKVAWVECSEWKPSQYPCNYLVWVKDFNRSTEAWLNGALQWEGYNNGVLPDVTHWAHMPKGPIA